MINNRNYWRKSQKELENSEKELTELLHIVRCDTEKNDQIENDINLALSNTKYKRKFFSVEPDDEIITDEILSLTLPIHAGTAAYTSASIVSARKEFEENLSMKNEWHTKHHYIFTTSTGDYEFNDIVTEVNEISQNPQLNEFEPITNKQLSRTEIFERLKNELEIIGNNYPILLMNSENKITSKEAGWIDDAVNSTVELIDRFLRNNAPNNQIKIQDWFVPNNDAKNGITRMHRVELFLRQKIGLVDIEIKKDIEYWGKEIKYSLNKLQKIKHSDNNENYENSVLEKIDNARLVLLNIILYQK